MVVRKNSVRVRERLKRSPAVVLVGPRQCGKTTLAKALTDTVYFDLERESDRVRLDVEWPGLVADTKCLVLDEVQTMPEVFSRLRSEIDARRKVNGRFLLLGSVAPSLMKRVSESLAGRMAVCEMTPFLAQELPEGRWDRLWCCGGYPDGGVLDERQFPDWQHDYLTVLTQRDFPVWGLSSLPPVTLRLLKMLAAVNGQQWNASQIAKGLGLSYHTVNSYVAFLEQAFLLRRIPAWSGNVLKRIVKAPRLYWRDSGLCHALLGLRSEEALLDQPWVGSSWEGWVVEQILGAFQLSGIDANPSWLRTQEGLEADLIVEFGAERWVLEIKLTSLPKADDFKALRKAAELVKATRAILVSRTPEVVWAEKEASTNLSDLLARVASLCSGGRGAGDGRRETGDGRRETGDGRRGTGDGGRVTGDGGRGTGDGMSVQTVKELEVYVVAYRLAMMVFEVSKRFPDAEKYSLTSQIRRSSRSVCLNLREAWAKRRYEAHFISKLTDCDGECNETDSSLDFAKDCGYLSEVEYADLVVLNRSVGKMLGAMLKNPGPFLLIA